ncbi:TetR/AcrR family transcriptional regulator [Lactiplantibacillus plantarum]|uniref:TetR/AcrR family transcriptional regulator n=1 Tax=Lactiplantibacillus plantarum TaxID=1590 RepID=UPI0009325A4E|nr:TetR/AcrR family transcriptional regulator [Lactiplantibacillus plantarum]
MDRTTQSFSQTLLKDAFARLLNTTGLSTITVQNLSRTAGINRSTFYRHFDNMDGFIDWFKEQMLDEIVDQFKSTEDGNIDFESFYQYALQNRKILDALLGWQGFIFQLRLRAIKKNAQLLKIRQSEIPSEVQAVFLVGGHISLLHWWISQKNPPSPKTMAKYNQLLSIPR